MPGMVLEVRPTLRMVSIMPGMDLRAPERTETSNGWAESPKRLPVSFSMRAMLAATSSRRPLG